MTSVTEETDRSANGADEAADATGVDPCGCGPQPVTVSRSADANNTSVELQPSNEDEATPGTETHRELKLVALLRPSNAGYEARLAAGSEGCDPELRVANVPGLAAALAVLADLVAAAETRWRVQRRYPVAAPPASAPRQRSATTTPLRSGGVQALDPQSGPPSGSPTGQAAPGTADSGQLSLFS